MLAIANRAGQQVKWTDQQLIERSKGGHSQSNGGQVKPKYEADNTEALIATWTRWPHVSNRLEPVTSGKPLFHRCDIRLQPLCDPRIPRKQTAGQSRSRLPKSALKSCFT